MVGSKHFPTIVVAMITAAVTAGAPAIAHGVQHALFAHDAAQVDGKSAVGSDASLNSRKGKLVAASATTGRLPNNIIAKARDAERLDGLDSDAFAAAAHNHDDLYYATGSKVANSDRLDGLDSTDFARRIVDHLVYSGSSASNDTVTDVAEEMFAAGTFTSERFGNHLLLANAGGTAFQASGPGYCEFQLRIDDELAASAFATTQSGEDATGLGFATTLILAPGEHEVSIWVRGAANSCSFNPGGHPVRYLALEIS